MAAAFLASDQPNPRKDIDRKTVLFLQCLFKRYKNNDPREKHQKALPLSIMQQMVTRSTRSMMLITFHQLFLLGFFYAMWSCENFKMSGKWCTEPLCKHNFIFMKDHNILQHNSPLLKQVDSLALVFEYQKRDQHDKSITQSKMDNPILCLIQAGAAIICCLQAMGASDDTFIYKFV